MKLSRWILGCGATVAAAVVASSPSFNVHAAATNRLIVAGIHAGSIADAGYNRTQHDALIYLKRHLRRAQVIEAEGVPGSAQAARVMQRMIDRGAKLIFAQSPAYEQATTRLAARNPSVLFEQLDGSRPASNVGTYSASPVAVEYGLGVAAAMVSKTGKIGFVAATRTSQLDFAVIAFVAGARSVNPNIRSALVYTGERPDRSRETWAVNALADQDADVVVSLVDSPIAVMEAAERRHVFAVGSYSASARRFAPRYWLSGVDFDWGPAYAQIARTVLAGRWKATDAPAAMHIARLAPFGPKVPKATQLAAARAVVLVESGRQTTSTAVWQPRGSNDDDLTSGSGTNL
jgi:basic membrane protein A and related proteins